MGILILLFFLIPILFIVFLLVDPFKAEREAKANREWDRWVEPYKNTKIPDDYLVDDRDKGNYIRGKRGGLYEIRYSQRTGKPYRHYF